MPVTTKNLESWDEFEQILLEEKEWETTQKEENEYEYISPLLFRGHASQNWRLETTLERYIQGKNCQQEFSWEEYYNILRNVKNGVCAFTNQTHDLPDNFPKISYDAPPGYQFMVYLRHHGFPSPLLDWTASPYIAAYFAFNDAHQNDDPCIFTFREYLGGAKSGWTACANIHGLGPNVVAHKRHHQQQCSYTICYKKDEDGKNVYCPHEEAEIDGIHQDKLCKYIIPRTERSKIMTKLNAMNINAFSLFNNEEGLAQMLAYKHIEGGETF